MPEQEQTSTVRFSRPHRKALRLTFEYDRDEVVLKDVQRVEMLVPASDPVREARTSLGSWVDLLDSAGRVLFRRALHVPLQQSVEVFSPEPGQTPSRINPPGCKGIFVVVIPDSDEGTCVALYHVPPVICTTTESNVEPRYYALNL
jgi:hypothetical protein